MPKGEAMIQITLRIQKNFETLEEYKGACEFLHREGWHFLGAKTETREGEIDENDVPVER